MELLSILWSYVEHKDSSGTDATPAESNQASSPYFLGTSPQVQTGMCCYHSWEFNLMLSFVSLVLWSILLATLSSVAVIRNEQERRGQRSKLCQARLNYIRQNIGIKRIRVKNNEEDSIHSSRATLTKSDATKTGSSDGTTDNADCGGCCSICLEDFCDGDEICESYNCRHQFHMNGCMSKWLLGHDECPVCRRDYLQCNHRICRSHHGKTRNYYVDPVPVNGLYDSGYYADDRWRLREAGLTAMGEFPPWFW